MKKTYAAPTVVSSGDAVRQTNANSTGLEAPVGNIEAPGSVGFYL